MHLAIDLRFYRPEPYGLAIHIRDLFTELITLLDASEICSKVSLILDQSNAEIDLSEYLPWWGEVVENPTFNVIFSQYPYYSWGEQVGFYDQLNTIAPDLTFFFTFNFPVRYNRPFVYQVLDLSIPKTRSQWNPKVQAMLYCMRQGLKKAKHTLFLGENTRMDAERFSDYQFHYPERKGYRPNTVIFNGLNPVYSKQPSINSRKTKVLDTLEYSQGLERRSKEFFGDHSINKPYILYTSVWRPYKNHLALAKAFDAWNDGTHQLVLAGRIDPKHTHISDEVKQLESYKQGNIRFVSDITDEEMIFLQDKAELFVAPTSSEGFGLWLVEASVRGTPVLCSDIKVFKDLCQDAAWYFEPNEEGILAGLKHVFSLPQARIDEQSQLLYQYTAQYRWNAVAHNIVHILEQTLFNESTTTTSA